MEATMLLCDFAEAVNGKLYIVGGGWTRLRPGHVLNCSVAVSVAVPWDRTNQNHKLRVELLSEDGETVNSPDGKPVQIDGEFEVGRPPGTKRGESIGNVMAFRIQGLELAPGGYKFSFKIDGTELAATPFRVQER